jgi:hypothetical protein
MRGIFPDFPQQPKIPSNSPVLPQKGAHRVATLPQRRSRINFVSTYFLACSIEFVSSKIVNNVPLIYNFSLFYDAFVPV